MARAGGEYLPCLHLFGALGKAADPNYIEPFLLTGWTPTTDTLASSSEGLVEMTLKTHVQGRNLAAYILDHAQQQRSQPQSNLGGYHVNLHSFPCSDGQTLPRMG